MAEAVKRRFLTWTLIRRVFIVLVILGVVAAVVVAAYVGALARDVPGHKVLGEYEPPVTSRVHAGDGTLIAEFADQHRVYVPYESVPEHVIQAFVSAEDKNFFEHEGLDYIGIIRAAMNTARNKITGDGGLQGGSTITQQVVKNMLLTREQTIERKIKEAIAARRVEQAFTKEQILELYLNEIYLGGRSYGVGSAALNYFNKSLTELDLSEAAILASLAKAPGTVNPYRRPERLIVRRNYVLGRMVEDGYVSQEEADAARALLLSTTRRLRGPEYDAATYFVQELRRDLSEQYGAETLQQGGLSIRTTIDTRLQLIATDALRNGLAAYDRRHGYRGPLASLDMNDDPNATFASFDMPSGHGEWEAALVAGLNGDGTARLRLADGSEAQLYKEDVDWAAETFEREGADSGLAVGDVILIEIQRTPMPEEARAAAEAAIAEDGEGADLRPGTAAAVPEPFTVPSGQATLRQIPAAEGALIALDPHTGRVLAMSGGFSFYKSPFNRVTQARRQIGSAFKPFVYAAALENGYTPTSKILDAPFVEFDVEADDFWSPGNYAEGRFYGLSTMRLGLEKSRNLMTVRLAQDIGMEAVSSVGERTGIYGELDPYLAMSLGAGETSVWNLARGYAALVNGGKLIEPTLLDRVQDRYGETLYVHDPRGCEGCAVDTGWQGGTPPQLDDLRPQVLDPIVAYQVVHMLEGVVQRGTATNVRRTVPDKPLAGKTGTTNDYKDALFFGFSPDLVVGIWVGFDEPRTLGEAEGGSAVAAPIFGDFMAGALENEPALPFRIPPGVRLVNIDARSGELPGAATDLVIMEAFRPGTEPGIAFAEDDGLDIFGSDDLDLFRVGAGRNVADEDSTLGLGTPTSDAPLPTDEFGFGEPGSQAPPDGVVDPAEEDASDSLVAQELGDTW